MNKNEAKRLARTLMNQHGLDHVPFEFDRSKRRLGACHWRGSDYFGYDIIKITLSQHYAELLPEDEIRNTILHEIAHALVGAKQGHSAAWKAMARKIGAKPVRCATPSAAPEASWIGKCSNGHISKQHRAPGRVKACGRCSSIWKPEHIFVWEKGGKIYNHFDIPSRNYRNEVIRLTARGISL